MRQSDALPRIVVLDGHTTNPGDLSWDPLLRLGQLTIHDRTQGNVVERALGAQILLTNKVRLERTTLEGLPELRLVSVLATGTNVVDIVAARDLGIVVCNAPDYSTPSVAQHTFALLLELTNRVGRHADHVRAGGWAESADFSYTLAPIRELAGATLGIVGLGAIGRLVAQIGRDLGMNVLATGRTLAPSGNDGEVRRVPLEILLRESDVVSLHCPLTEATHHLIDAARLELMKPGALLINTGRGDLIDESAVSAALDAGTLGGAALDVLSREPPDRAQVLATHPRCIVTPHVAWASVAARQRLIDVSAENVRLFLAGTPQNTVT